MKGLGIKMVVSDKGTIVWELSIQPRNKWTLFLWRWRL